MTTRFACFIFAVALGGLAPPAANACVAPINLPAIEQRMVDPALAVDLKQKVIALRARARVAVEAGQRNLAQRLYRQVEDLLGLTPPPGPYRCG